MGKALMLQGTMSDTGKSFITAGICRYLSNKGYKVAPFKSQNMASNCHVTDDGLQLGRAQALQAVAARCPIDARLNPILLKPKTNVGSEVILEGKSQGFMSAREYFKIRKTFYPVVEKCFNSLIEENDFVIIEGAGSPAEINLKKDDIVNMGIAKMAKAPVLLIGDIDRGGVFASLYGTYELLEENEKKYVKGFIINKFRGDKSLLMPGIDMFYDKLPIETLGIMPYLDIMIDEEDSLSKKSKIPEKTDVDIAVIDFAGMKNFYDFLIFKEYDNVALRYVKDPLDAKEADIIIIPDFETANYDKYPFKSELSELIKEKSVVVLGSGNKIIEDSKAIGNFEEDIRPQMKAAEINSSDSSCWNFLNGILVKGFCSFKGDTYIKLCDNVFSSLISGIFANREITEAILNNVLKSKGKALLRSHKEGAFIDSQLDILAGEIEKNLNMTKILEIAKKGI